MAHENGSVESAHGLLKRAINDAPLLRGSTDFADLDAYHAFIDMIVERHNARRDKSIDSERVVLQSLPDIAEYRERFTAVEQVEPEVVVTLPELSVFDELLDAVVAP